MAVMDDGHSLQDFGDIAEIWLFSLHPKLKNTRRALVKRAFARDFVALKTYVENKKGWLL